MGRVHTGHSPNSDWHIISMRSNRVDIEDVHPFSVADYQHAIYFCGHTGHPLVSQKHELRKPANAQQPMVSRRQERLRGRTMVWPLLNPNQFTCGHNAQHLKIMSGKRLAFRKVAQGVSKAWHVVS